MVQVEHGVVVMTVSSQPGDPSSKPMVSQFSILVL